MKIPVSISRAKEYSTHNSMLIKTVLMSKGPVLEVGAGFYSTPLLHWLCKNLDRLLITYESDPTFFAFARNFMSRGHRIRFIKNWDDMDFKTHYGVVLIDHSPKRPRTRGMDALKFKDTADYIVIHDTGPVIEEKYGYEAIWPHFKYRYTWKEAQPWTTVVSNFKKLSNL
jgi:hypothetical protein